jgi:hypothetical protein
MLVSWVRGVTLHQPGIEHRPTHEGGVAHLEQQVARHVLRIHETHELQPLFARFVLDMILHFVAHDHELLAVLHAAPATPRCHGRERKRRLRLHLNKWTHHPPSRRDSAWPSEGGAL